MANNDFKMDTTSQGEKLYLKRMKGIIIFAILLTGTFSLGGVAFIMLGISGSLWNDIGVAAYVQQSIIYLTGMFTFIALIKIYFDSKPFSKTLNVCIQSIGIMFTVSSFVIPRLSGYVSSGFELFAINSFVLSDGVLLTFGLLLIILSTLIKGALETQNEMEEVL